MALHHTQAGAGQAFDVAQEGAFAGVAERQRDPGGAGAAGAADPVNVVLGLVGQLEVDDVGDAIHVDPARRDVSGHQHADAALLEAGQGALTRRLALVAVDRFGGAHPAPVQVLGDTVGAVLGAGEDQHAGHGPIAQHLRQEVALVVRLHMQDPLGDLLGRAGRGRDRHRDRIA